MPNKLLGLRSSEIAEMVLTDLIFKIYLRYVELILLFVYNFNWLRNARLLPMVENTHVAWRGD